MRWVRLAMTVLAATGLVACGGDEVPAGPPVAYRGDTLAVQVGTLTARDVAQAQTAFGIDLLHAVCAAKDPGTNILVSPTSAAEALALLYPAAGGQTAQDIGAMLHLPPWSPDLVAAMRDHTQALDGLSYEGDLEAEDAPDSLSMSNDVWPVVGSVPEQSYLDDVATALGAGVQSLDFAGDPQGSTDTINRSVSEDTHGLIEKLFDEPLGPETVAVLTNAIHLKARWATPFVDTQEGPFTTPSGSATVDMMRGGSGAARSADGWLSVEMPYVDATMRALAILPPSGTDPCSVDAQTLDALEADDPEGVDVTLPRLHLEQKHQLLDVLADLGLPEVGEYPALGAEGISQVVQKTYLDVDEEGTEAAAATGIVTWAVSEPLPQDQVTFDRPFLLVLTDTATGSPLFFTVVNDPTV